MAQRTDPDSFLQLSRDGVVVDVRTPAEFADGHIPGAHNIPLFSNEERAVVGTIYKRQGHDPAVQKGLEFVGPRMAEIARQARKLAAGREIFLYCWRGGMRSGSVAWLLETAGMKTSLLAGGYKAYRRSFEELLARHAWRFVMLKGTTGCGKTELLARLSQAGEQVLDFEGLASHKGSAFGGIGQQEQPTTEHFINLLHNRFREFSPQRPVWCEGESLLVGRVFIPQNLFDLVRTGLTVHVEMAREQRLDRLMVEYGSFPQQMLEESFRKISKRMGPEKATEAIRLLAAGDVRGAASLALDYYDKVYARNVGEPDTIVEFMADNDDMAACTARLVELKNKFPGYDN